MRYNKIRNERQSSYRQKMKTNSCQSKQEKVEKRREKKANDDAKANIAYKLVE